MFAVPTLDMTTWRGGSADARLSWALRLTELAHEVGFFHVGGHGIPLAQLEGILATTRALFALPTEVKARIDKRNSACFRGWEPVGSERTNGQPDLREQVDLWTEYPVHHEPGAPTYRRLLGPNPWLPESVLPGHRGVIREWLATTDDLASDLLDAFGLGLGLPEDALRTRFGQERMSLLKLIHYPETPPGSAGVNPHHDAGFLTLLLPDSPGLEVEGPDGAWHPVPFRPGHLVLNLGEVLQAMTGNYLVATPHRVVASHERWSVGYFHGPALDMSLEPLALDARFAAAVAASPRHAGAGFMAPRAEVEAGVGAMRSSHRPQVYGDQLWNYFLRSYPELVAAHHPDLARR